MSDDVIITDARIIERVEAGRGAEKPRMGFGEMVLWAVLSAAWYAVVRLMIVGLFSLPWLIGGGKSTAAAASWMLLGTPIAVGLAAFLTMQTNTRNRELHFVMTCVIFASALLFHINLTLGNPSVTDLPGGTKAMGWFLQTALTAAGAGAGMVLVRRRRAKRAQQQPALPGSE
jgi:fucose 4-O-acetylase-like acetyltransferase